MQRSMAVELGLPHPGLGFRFATRYAGCHKVEEQSVICDEPRRDV